MSVSSSPVTLSDVTSTPRSRDDLRASTIEDDIPRGRLLAPEEVTVPVVFLCRERALDITMENIQISAGAVG